MYEEIRNIYKMEVFIYHRQDVFLYVKLVINYNFPVFARKLLKKIWTLYFVGWRLPFLKEKILSLFQMLLVNLS